MGRAQVKAGICRLSSEMAGNLDFILNLFRVEGGLHDPLGKECNKWGRGSREFVQVSALVIQVQSDGGW